MRHHVLKLVIFVISISLKGIYTVEGKVMVIRHTINLTHSLFKIQTTKQR